MRFKRFLGNERGMEIEMKNGTLQDVLNVLSSSLGAQFREVIYEPETQHLKKNNMILVNGQSYMNLEGGLNTILKDGDEISFMPVLVGG